MGATLKTSEILIYKLQSDSWKTWFSNADLQILMKITVLPLWVTLNGLRNFMMLSVFSKFQTIEKTKKTRVITFAGGFPVFLALGLHQCTLKGFHWTRTCGKTCISRIIAKTKEIATFRPPIFAIKTIWFFVFYENSIAFKHQKNMTSQKTI